MTEPRRPQTIEQAIVDCTAALKDPDVKVIPTNALMLEMVTLLARIKHS